MKRQNVLILYVFGKDIVSISKREAVFHALQTQMEEQGRKAISERRDSRGKTITFDDKSQLMLYAFGTSLQGQRLTHLYIDKESESLPNSSEYIEKCVMPSLIDSTNTVYVEMDVQKKKEKRVIHFDYTSQRKLRFEPFFTN